MAVGVGELDLDSVLPDLDDQTGKNGRIECGNMNVLGLALVGRGVNTEIHIGLPGGDDLPVDPLHDAIDNLLFNRGEGSPLCEVLLLPATLPLDQIETELIRKNNDQLPAELLDREHIDHARALQT